MMILQYLLAHSLGGFLIVIQSMKSISSTVYIGTMLVPCVHMLTKHSHTVTQIQIYISRGHPHGKD